MIRILDICSKYILGCGLALAMFVPGAHAAGFKVLHTFTNGSDGAEPAARLIADREGNLYGTSFWGGGGGNCPTLGCGTVFKIAKDGTESVLYAFCLGQFCTDGQYPSSGLIEDKAGNLYGTTGSGGSTNAYGTVFRLAPDGSETVLYSFQGGNDGSNPVGDLIWDKAGNLYGTTGNGGAGFGTIFKLAPDGTESVLYAFAGGSDGGTPQSGVIADSAGNLYGTTAYGGDSTNCPGAQHLPAGCGIVFKLAPNGTEVVLHDFEAGSDGTNPAGGLTAGTAGTLYGTTQYGGDPTNCPSRQNFPAGCGVVFELAPNGTETLLYIFKGGRDGAHPRAGLVADETGNLYGTTYWGGDTHKGFCSLGCGTVFEVTSSGAETVLHSFKNLSATGPSAGLILRRGNLYGTTVLGGGTGCQGTGCGTVFKLKE